MVLRSLFDLGCCCRSVRFSPLPRGLGSFCFPRNPLSAFRSSSESDDPCAAAVSSMRFRRIEILRRLPPLRFLPLRRLPGFGQPLMFQAYQSGTTVPSQRFSRSQGFRPPRTCRLCFVPVPSLGLHPSGTFSTHGAPRSLDRACPLGVGLPYIYRFCLSTSRLSRIRPSLLKRRSVETASCSARPASGLSSP